MSGNDNDEIVEEVEVDESEDGNGNVVTVAGGLKRPVAPVAGAGQSVDTFAGEVGIIIPPPDLKLTVDKTADFVRRNGRAFEAEIVKRNAKSKKFFFLQPSNPYHAYYLSCLQGDGSIIPPADITNAQASLAVPKNEARPVVKKVIKKVKKVTLQEKLQQVIRDAKAVRNPLTVAPPADRYSVTTPDNYTALDIDIIKLTAQFVARNGRAFLVGLNSREGNNRQFEFLKPVHPLFPYFQSLVEAYNAIVTPPKHLLAQIKDEIDDNTKLLDTLLSRASYIRQVRVDDEKNQASQEQERVAMQLIDWHSFVVVETITFVSDDEEFLPQPKNSIEDINRMLAAQELEDAQRSTHMDQSSNNNNGNINGNIGGGHDNHDHGDMDMDMDLTNEDHDDGDDFAVEAARRRAAVIEAEAAEEEPMVVKEYEALLEEQRLAADKSTKYAKCPICREEIAVEDLSEHMRIELLDPKWKEQKQIMMDKQKDTSLAENRNIGASLSRIARNRQDLFVNAEDAKRREAEELEHKNIWEAHTQSAQLQASQQKAQKATGLPITAGASSSSTPSSSNSSGKKTAPISLSAPLGGTSGNTNTTATNRVPSIATIGLPAAIANAASSSSATTSGNSNNSNSNSNTGAPVRAPPIGGVNAPFPFGLPVPPPVTGISPYGTYGTSGVTAGGLAGLPLPLPSAAAVAAAAAAGRPLLPLPLPLLSGHMAPPLPSMVEPQLKKPKLAPSSAGKANQKTEEEFMALFPGAITIQVLVPHDDDNKDWKFNGQTLDITLDVKDTLTTLKDRLNKELGMPQGKMKINIQNGPFLNTDKFTMAYYNVGPGAVLQLAERTRGGRK